VKRKKDVSIGLVALVSLVTISTRLCVITSITLRARLDTSRSRPLFFVCTHRVHGSDVRVENKRVTHSIND